MSEGICTVGDVVAWPDVPVGAVVRDSSGEYAVRFREHRGQRDEERVTIIALNVPADATADDLRALAERFEVREALREAWKATDWKWCEFIVKNSRDAWTPDEDIPHLAERLHAAGWRSNMTAEDAARLLAGVR